MLHNVVSAFQALAIVSLSGKGYLEREKPAADLTALRKQASMACDPKTQKLRAQAQAHFVAVHARICALVDAGDKFRELFERWHAARQRSLLGLKQYCDRLAQLEAKIQGSDAASGSFGVVGGALTLAGLALAPATGGGSAALVAGAGLGVEALSCLFSASMLTLKVAGTKRCTRGLRELLDADRALTEELAALSKALVDARRDLLESADEAAAFLEAVGVGAYMMNTSKWTKERKLDVLFNSGEALGAWHFVALELLMKAGVLDGNHAAAALGRAAGQAAEGRTAANAVAAGVARLPAARPLRAPVVASTAGAANATAGAAAAGAAPAAKPLAKPPAAPAPLPAAPAALPPAAPPAGLAGNVGELGGTAVEAAAGACAGAGEGAAAAAAGGAGGHGSAHVHAHAPRPVLRAVGVGLTVSGMGLALLAAVRASRKLLRGCHSEVGEVLEAVAHELEENRREILLFYRSNIWLETLHQVFVGCGGSVGGAAEAALEGARDERDERDERAGRALAREAVRREPAESRCSRRRASSLGALRQAGAAAAELPAAAAVGLASVCGVGAGAAGPAAPLGCSSASCPEIRTFADSGSYDRQLTKVAAAERDLCGVESIALSEGGDFLPADFAAPAPAAASTGPSAASAASATLLSSSNAGRVQRLSTGEAPPAGVASPAGVAFPAGAFTRCDCGDADCGAVAAQSSRPPAAGAPLAARGGKGLGAVGVPRAVHRSVSDTSTRCCEAEGSSDGSAGGFVPLSREYGSFFVQTPSPRGGI